MSDRLFAEETGEHRAPLAVRMRPRTLSDFVGQRELLGEGSALRQAIEAGRAHSMILIGPPGVGKTTLARIVAASAAATLEELSAVSAGRPEVRGVLDRAAHRRALGAPPTVFFLDEIHRFNKAQQDVLLGAVEEGLVVLIGATTENPAFEVNAALLSRTRVYALHPLEEADILLLLRRAVAQGEAAPAEDGALELIAARAAGDARAALGALELAGEGSGGAPITVDGAAEALGRAHVVYDRAGDRHYDLISAWIKATRGSDPDASLLYLAVMLEGGEDPRFISRRMVILASEDIGNADPQALTIATAAAAAVDRVGLPEAHYTLAQAAVYLALAPKSDAAGQALWRARRLVREQGAPAVPAHLRSGPRPGEPTGEPYDLPHRHPGGLSAQELMPSGLERTRFFEPGEAERALAERLAAVRRGRGR